MKLSQPDICGEVKIMRAIRMMALPFLVAAFGAVVIPTASAQTMTCDLVLDVVTKDKTSEARPADDARATALNTSNHQSVSASFVLGKLRFFELPEGRYWITVTKRGFKRAVLPLSFKCEWLDAEATVPVNLEPGNYKRSVIARSQSIVANSQAQIPPIRRGVTTVLGTSDGSEPTAGEELPSSPPVRPPTTPPRAPISGGVLNGKAISLPPPPYPPTAHRAGASGSVVVQVLIDEEGNVISARAVSGHPLLQAVCVESARGARFFPTKLAGQPVKVTGVITYNFVAE